MCWLERLQDMIHLKKEHVEKVRCSPTKSFKQINPSQRANKSFKQIIRQPKVQAFKMFFLAHQVSCHYQGPVPAIETFVPLGPVWRCGWNYVPPFWVCVECGVGLWGMRVGVGLWKQRMGIPWFQIYCVVVDVHPLEGNDSNLTKRWLNSPQHLAMLARLVKDVRRRNKMYNLGCPPSHPFPVIVANEGL